MLAELLEGLAQGRGSLQPSLTSDDIMQAHELLDTAALDAAPVGGWDHEQPLRVTKGRLRWLLQCPKRAVAGEASAGDPTDLVLGQLVDAAAKLLALSARRPVTVDDALGFIGADGDELAARHLADIGEHAAADLLRAATARIAKLEAAWPGRLADWWPRVEEPIRVPLAGGSVLLTGRFDVLLGGRPTAQPSVVIEVKSGSWHDAVWHDAHFYGLMLALRDGEAPGGVVSLSAQDGATQAEPIRPAVLHHVAEQVATAIETAAALASGEVPEAHGGRHCIICHLRNDCPSARALGGEQPVTVGPGPMGEAA